MSSKKFAHVRAKYRSGGFEYLGAIEVDQEAYEEHGIFYIWAIHTGVEGISAEEILETFRQGMENPESVSMMRFKSARPNEEVWINPFEVCSWRVTFSDSSANAATEEEIPE